MRKLFTLLFVVISLGATAQSSKLLYFWSFDAASGAQTDLFTPDFTIGGASLSLAGASVVTGNYPTTDTINQQVTPKGATNYMKIATPYSAFIWTLPTTGYKNIVVEYAEFASSKGSKTNTISYSLDGGKTWDSTGMVLTHVDNGTAAATTTLTGVGTYNLTNTTGTPMDKIVLDFSNIKGANDNPLFEIQTNYVETGGGNDRYHNLSVNGDPITLAVSLQSFNGSIVNNTAKLNWTSVNEINAKQFVVEASTDRKNFSTVGSVTAKNTKGLNSYSFETAAAATTTYYRLKMVDKNGAFSYSAIVVLNTAVSSKKLTVFPNPAVNNITLSHAQALAGASIKIVNAAGKTVSVSNLQTGASQTTVDVSKLKKGSYIVTIENNGEKAVSQFVK